MTPRGTLGVAGLVVALSVASTIAAQQQTQTFHKPIAPIGPTSEDQCRALEADWSMLCKRISDAHQQCLDGYNGSDVKGAGQCSRGPCLSLHQQMTTCGGEERRQAVDACHVQVREVKAREAEFKRLQEAAVRAQQQAELEHRQKLEAEAVSSIAQANDARARAEAYRRSTPASSSRNPTLDDRQAGLVEAARRQADGMVSAVRDTIDRVKTEWSEADFSRISASSRDLLRDEGKEAFMESLSHSERFSWIPDVVGLSTEVADVATRLMNGVSNVRGALTGTSTPEDNWNAVLDGIESISDYGSRIPLLRFPAISQVGGVVSGLRETHSHQFEQLYAIRDAFLENRSYVLPETYDREVMRDLVGRLIPLDRFERIERFGNDVAYTWDDAKNRIYRIFNP